MLIRFISASLHAPRIAEWEFWMISSGRSLLAAPTLAGMPPPPWARLHDTYVYMHSFLAGYFALRVMCIAGGSACFTALTCPDAAFMPHVAPREGSACAVADFGWRLRRSSELVLYFQEVSRARLPAFELLLDLVCVLFYIRGYVALCVYLGESSSSMAW